MVRFIYPSLLILLLLLAGCDSGTPESKRPYLMTHNPPTTQKTTPPSKPISKAQEKITLTAIEAAHREKLATIASQKEVALQKLETERSIHADQSMEKRTALETQSRLEIEKQKQKAAIEIAKARTSLYRQYLIAAVAIMLFLMLFFYLIHRRNQRLKLKLHEDELRHKEYLQASKQHHERISKTLELLASESTDKTLKKELVKLLKDQGNDEPKLLN